MWSKKYLMPLKFKGINFKWKYENPWWKACIHIQSWIHQKIPLLLSIMCNGGRNLNSYDISQCRNMKIRKKSKVYLCKKYSSKKEICFSSHHKYRSFHPLSHPISHV